MSEADFLRRWVRAAPSWLLSLAAHALLLAAAGMISWVVLRARLEDRALILHRPPAGADEAGEETGSSGGGAAAPAETRPQEAPRAALVPPAPAPAALEAALAEVAPTATADALTAGADAFDDLARALAASPHAIGAAAGQVGVGLLDGTSSGFGQHIGQLRGMGLDLVLVLDATDSMTPYIEQAKKRLHQILDVVTGLVPNARLGMVAYKDYGDDYGPEAVRLVPLAERADDIRKFIDQTVAGGGADIPEPIHEAVRAATSEQKMGWNRRRKRIVLLVGDSPCHASGRSDAFAAAAAFARQGGTINVVDVGGTGTDGPPRATLQPDLARVAQDGGGEAFLLKDAGAFWRHLIVSVFGQRFEQDVEVIIKRLVREEGT